MTDIDAEYLDQDAVCRFLGGSKAIHPATLFRLVKSGKVPRPIKISPNKNRWLRRELEAAIAQRVAERDQVAA